MSWTVEYLEEAKRDLRRLDHSVQLQVLKGIAKVAQNPVSVHDGGYGKPLGNRSNVSLSGLFKIKFRDLGLRVVYQLIVTGSVMKIVVISARTDGQVYQEAARRKEKFGL